jgi:hypothetical protein
LLAALSIGSDAAGFELRAWPLLEASRRSERLEARLLGPLVEWRSDSVSSALTIRPLLSSSRSGDGVSRGWLLYPLVSWSRSPHELSIRFFLLGSYVARSDPPAERPYQSELTIFPLVFYRRATDAGSSFSLLPLYGNVERLFGYQRVRMLLFPLYLSLEEPLWRRTWALFPFYSRVGGQAGRGWRLWPIYGHTQLGGEYESQYLLWPFSIRAVSHPGQNDETTSRISWPLFSAVDGPTLHSRSYAFLLVLPLYTRTVDLARDTDTRGFPWPLWVEQIDRRSGERRSLRLTPFFGRRRTATLDSVFYLWPFYRQRTGRGEDAAYRRTDVLFVMYRDQWEGEAAERRHIRALVPLWVERDGGPAEDAQSLTLLDGLFPTNQVLRDAHAPLYRLYGSETRGGVRRHDLLWRMFVWGDGKVRPPWYFSAD